MCCQMKCPRLLQTIFPRPGSGWSLEPEAGLWQLRTSPGQAATTDSNILLCSFLCHPTDSVKYVL